ncbi:hypothetical protein [Streptomyces durocortorensis]|uniref:PH domain-containing protein n=1 Tax=Streptomyces durocortorensis TaxID=2811104 RepID=A0ABS2HYH9_9ACTN|nr:hypothetical protein [Streptomyces durocortorensis]MBM7056029.1 hypothetical protein [Streptomyces durocortorensis]
MAVMIFCAAAAIGLIKDPLIGVAACLGTIVLTRRIGTARIILGKSELKVVNPVFTYRVPYRLVMDVDTSTGGTLTVHTTEGEEIHSTAFGGSLLDHFFGTSDRAVARIKEIVRQRRGPRTEAQARRTLTVSWIADFCLLGTIGVAVAALLTSG